MGTNLYPYFVFDVETSTERFGSPFDDSNVLVSVAAVLATSASERTEYTIHLFEGRHVSDPFVHPANGGFSTLLAPYLHSLMVVGHNVKFDLHWAKRGGLGIEGFSKIWDTMFAGHVCGGMGVRKALSLNALSEGGKDNLGNRLIHDIGANPLHLPPSWVVWYNLLDVRATERLFLQQFKEING